MSATQPGTSCFNKEALSTTWHKVWGQVTLSSINMSVYMYKANASCNHIIMVILVIYDKLVFKKVSYLRT